MTNSQKEMKSREFVNQLEQYLKYRDQYILAKDRADEYGTRWYLDILKEKTEYFSIAKSNLEITVESLLS